MNHMTQDRLPKLWWLNPWLTALELHKAFYALKHLSDLDDRAITLLQREVARQDNLITEYQHALRAKDAELTRLNRGLDELERVLGLAPKTSQSLPADEGRGRVGSPQQNASESL